MNGDEKDDDEFGLPRESAIKIATRQVTETITNNIISTWQIGDKKWIEYLLKILKSMLTKKLC